MENRLKLKKVSYSDKYVDLDILYSIFADVILENIKKGECEEYEKDYSSIA